MATTPFSSSDFSSSDVPRSDPSRSDEQAHLLVEQLLGSASRLGCGSCGLPLQEHGRSIVHRFVRPQLPSGYHYLDESGTGEERVLRGRPTEQLTVVPEGRSL